MSNKRAIFLIISVVMLSVLWCANTVTVGNTKPTQIYTLQKQNVDITKSLTGKIVCEKEQIVLSDSDYAIDELLVACGDFIEKGEPIASIDIEKTKELALKKNPAANIKTKQYITSNYTGLITDIMISEDCDVQNGDTVLSLLDYSGIKVCLSVPEETVKHFCVGNKAEITGNGFDNKYWGKISKIENTADANSPHGNVKVEVSVDSPDFTIKIGYTAKCCIYYEKMKNCYCVPKSCINEDSNNKTYVVKPENGKYKKVFVEEAGYSEGKVIIKGEGLADKMNIVFDIEDAGIKVD